MRVVLTAVVLALSARASHGFSFDKVSLERFRGHGVHGRLHEDFEREGSSLFSHLHSDRAHSGSALMAPEPPAPAQFYDDALLDHADPQSARWRQRFFVNESVWGGPGYPIFLYIGGEGPLSGSAVSKRLFVSDLAEEHKALKVALEHRFYGEVGAGSMGLALPRARAHRHPHSAACLAPHTRIRTSTRMCLF